MLEWIIVVTAPNYDTNHCIDVNGFIYRVSLATIDNIYLAVRRMFEEMNDKYLQCLLTFSKIRHLILTIAGSDTPLLNLDIKTVKSELIANYVYYTDLLVDNSVICVTSQEQCAFSSFSLAL